MPGTRDNLNDLLAYIQKQSFDYFLLTIEPGQITEKGKQIDSDIFHKFTDHANAQFAITVLEELIKELKKELESAKPKTKKSKSNTKSNKT